MNENIGHVREDGNYYLIGNLCIHTCITTADVTCSFCPFFFVQVLYFANMGDFATSIALSDSARYWTRITVVLGIVSYLAITILVIVLKVNL